MGVHVKEKIMLQCNNQCCVTNEKDVILTWVHIRLVEYCPNSHGIVLYKNPLGVAVKIIQQRII